MKVIEGILYVEFTELVSCGVSENTLKDAKKRNASSWSFINDPLDKRRVLVQYERLKEDYKDKVRAKFGNPYEYVCREPIRQLVKWDNKAEQWFFDYKYGENNEHTLKPETQKKYTIACNWLNMLVEVNADKKLLKKTLKLTMDEFYDHVIAMLKLEQVDLPMSYRRLLAKVSDFKERGYRCMIDPRFGNQNSAKVIRNDVSEALLLEMIAHHNQFDDVFIQQQYNLKIKQLVDENGKQLYKPITSATVGVHRRNKDHLVVMQREGNAKLKDKYLPQVKGFRPTAPLYLVESDDNHLDLLFNVPDAPKATGRYTAIVVKDSFNDYVLGYAYALNGTLGKNESIALVKAAYVNAMYYIRSITGSWYLPWETKTDNWGIAQLKPFYMSMGNYIQTPVGSKNRGYIENSFGTPHWKRCLKAGKINYTGNNVTARNRGVNIEFLAKAKKDRPMIGTEAENYIEQFFHRLRFMPQSNGKSKHDEWFTAWEALPNEDKKEISDEMFLMKFGVEHLPKNGSRNTITNRGIEPTINGVKYSYDLDAKDLFRYVGKTVSIFYDPFDMSRVLITDYDKIRLIAKEARLHSRALRDASVDSRKYLNAVLAEKTDTVNQIADAKEKRQKLLKIHEMDAQMVIETGYLLKEVRQYSEQVMLNRMIDGEDAEEIDFNEWYKKIG